MKNRSAEVQAIEYMKKKQDKVIDNMAEWQMYRFAMEALKEKEERSHGCDCCQGDEALYWADDENNAFVDSKGNILTTIKGMTMRYNVKCCPKCGKKF